MPLSTPHYIPVKQLVQEKIQHEWSDWDPYEKIAEPDKNTLEALSKISNRALTAFSIGCAEWVTYRFSMVSTDKTPLDFLESCWVLVMGNDDIQLEGLEESEWKGPIRGAIDLSLLTIVNAWNKAEFGSTEADGAFAAQLALLVIPPKALFLEWQEKVLQRLVSYYPRNADDPDGPPVAREILDPEVNFDVLQADLLINTFLHGVDFSSNPFLQGIDPELDE